MILKERERKRLADRIRKTLPCSEVLLLGFGECIIEVHVTDREIRKGLVNYFQAFVLSFGQPHIRITVHETEAVEIGFPLVPKQPDPGKTRIKEEYADLPDGRIVRKRLTGMAFVFGGEDHIAIGPCLQNLNQVVNFINSRYIAFLLDAGGILVHAAGVVLNGWGIGLAGFSGMGKSTLSLHLLDCGADFISNDRLVLQRDGTGLIMHGVAKLPRVNPGTILNNPRLIGLLPKTDVERYLRMSREKLWAVEHKFDVPLDTCFPNCRFLLRHPMHALILLNWKQEGGPVQIRRVSLDRRRDLFPAFIKSTGLFYLHEEGSCRRDPEIAVYLEYVKGVAVYEVRGGIDFQPVLDFCRGLVSHHSPITDAVPIDMPMSA